MCTKLCTYARDEEKMTTKTVCAETRTSTLLRTLLSLSRVSLCLPCPCENLCLHEKVLRRPGFLVSSLNSSFHERQLRALPGMARIYLSAEWQPRRRYRNACARSLPWADQRSTSRHTTTGEQHKTKLRSAPLPKWHSLPMACA